MLGLIKTEPIKDVINGIQKFCGIVLDTKTAATDPVSGVKKAVDFCYKKIAVTVANPKPLSLHRPV